MKAELTPMGEINIKAGMEGKKGIQMNRYTQIENGEYYYHC